MLEPFWTSAVMCGESLMSLEAADGHATASLLFPPVRGLSLTSATGQVLFEEGRDHAVDLAAGTCGGCRDRASRAPREKSFRDSWPPKTLWTESLARKSDFDSTGNGLNHPNDFGHRLYAQMILALLTG